MNQVAKKKSARVKHEPETFDVKLLEKLAGAEPEGDAPSDQTAVVLLSQVKELISAIETQNAVPGYVIAPVKSGYSVALLVNSRKDAEDGVGVRAFLPSRLASLTLHEKQQLLQHPQQMFHVVEYTPSTGSVIVSRREFLLGERKEAKKALWEKIAEGDVVEGVIKSVVPYGAFVDIGGALGLLHISDVAWEKTSGRAALQMGQKVTVKIIELDKKAHKLKLGIKQLVPNPWQEAKNHVQDGHNVEGDVVALTDFGVFVRLPDGLEGLIHSSEISWQRFKHPSQMFKIGDHIKARVLHFDQAAKRISLSTKALERNPVEAVQEKFPVGAVLKTTVVGVKDFGIFVALDEHIAGLVHVGELSWTRRIEDPAELYKEGQEVEVVVFGYDTQRQRVSCSIKRLQEDPWRKWRATYAKGTRHQAKVHKLLQNGIECELEPELIAYCSLRELSSEPVGRPQDVVKVGDTIDVEVILCDPAEHRVTVSVKARTQHETQEDYQMYLKRQKESGAGRTTFGDAIGRASKASS